MSSNSKNILFRANSSSTIGTGHIMRDLVLAKQYHGNNITFATQDLQGNINPKIVEAKYPIEILKSNNIKELDLVIKKLKIDMLVIDSYDINYKFEKKIKNLNPKLKILSFDDTYQKHYCDILLNHNISANSKKYKGLVPKECELRCGSRYTLIREEFLIEKKKNHKKKSTKDKTIFLAMGGADYFNVNIKVLRVLEKFKNIRVNVVTTTANQNLNELKSYTIDKKWLNLHINSNKIAKLIRKSDFAIITPSVIANEVYFMQTPFIAIKTADNQSDIYNFLKKNSFLVLSNINNNSKFLKYLKDFI